MSDGTIAQLKASIPWGLIGTVGLVLLVETQVSRNLLSLSEQGIVAFATAAGALRSAVQARMLCFGDSQIKYGVVPWVIEQETGRRAYNLAVPGATPATTYYLLKRYLDGGARPEAVVVGFKATQLQVDPLIQLDLFAGSLTLREALDLCATAADATYFGKLLAIRTLPSLGNRSGLRTLILTSFQGRPFPQLANNLTAIRNWNVNQGSGLLPKNPDVEGPAPYWDEVFYDKIGDWRFDHRNAIYVKRFLQMAAARKIPVYWVLTPVNPRLQASRDRLDFDRNYTKMVGRAVAQFANLTVIDGRHSGYPTRLFVDSSHFNHEGAFIFSVELAEVLRRSAPSTQSRWIDLPAYRPRPLPANLEVEERSRLALFGRPIRPVPSVATPPATAKR